MIEETLITIIYILFYTLIEMAIITVALIIAVVVIISKKQ